MNWKLCIADPQKNALDLCCGSMDEGNGYSNCYGDSRGDGWGDGADYGGTGDGKGSGYGGTWGDGGCPPSWK